MFGLGDQAADRGFDRRRCDCGQFGARFAEHPFGERGTAGYRSCAAANLVADFGDEAIVPKTRGQSQNVAASGIRNLNRDRRRGKFTHVARILEMIEEGFAIQSLFIMRRDWFGAR